MPKMGEESLNGKVSDLLSYPAILRISARFDFAMSVSLSISFLRVIALKDTLTHLV